LKKVHKKFLLLPGLLILVTELLFATFPAGEISTASELLLERLRHKHQPQDRINRENRIDELVNKIKQKHEQSEAKQTLAPSEQADRSLQNDDEPAVTDSEALPEAVKKSVTSASAAADDEEVILAESYETATLTETPGPEGVSSSFSQKEQSSSKKDELSFKAFFATLIALFLAFSLGNHLIDVSRQGGQPGTAEKAGLVLLAISFIGSIFAFVRFWPILVLFAIAFILGGSRGSRDSGDCGCGCGGCLMIIIIILLLF
jgi:hypothetical protein